jgi:hypothetical protein
MASRRSIRVGVTDEQRKRMMKLAKSDHAAIERECRSIEYGDLYRALHNVGDDNTKVSIEDALFTLLDEATFCKVVAIFKVAVSP